LDSMKCEAGEKEIKDFRIKATAWKTPRPAPGGAGLDAGFSTPFLGGWPRCRGLHHMTSYGGAV